MIKTFSSKSLRLFWEFDDSSKLDARMVKKIRRMLDALNGASNAQDLHLPGFGFHLLNGFRPTRFAISVNGPWRITFEFRDGDAYAVDLEQYH